ncbi:chemotaxis response regulator protein-glutamate methylesterase [Komagataeibacter rhaeticus]|uniref:Protein-glutamate methylesterase/protein-glutamine glutaminase n=2 Tax=Komagataeibacter rhaeticus TaxID=215221 RepID=A0A181CC42_9PROT|nr:chemotaxis-specific protein-glutamate methyltransferase CheB [Komagataeibacter rhaeticus]ATU72006.1 chemotaxis-specific protein-glutamate methyltransferase CheB [Komagataeibacter xylinus]EGG75420.1 Chemotaxis response regulator protein-glutamate methylesterase 2 [Gluconacetobacter sp. SXCC-1]MBL7239421.1 chemotaxis-specific protein-glutamate methyltransferase CheB [Komagataeibacter rhaeticus]PYD54573.1 chemotaxis response regulator protein-glutamate methylesterase [Komagataeibacter rhaeticus
MNAPPAPRRVLIVEDSAVLRHLLMRVVAGDPRLELLEAVETAEEALRLVPRLRPDVISMDICLPGMDGLEATRQIMAHFPTPIVIVSDTLGGQSTHVSMNALRSGALSVMEKPQGLSGAAGAAMAQGIATQLYIMSQVPVIRRRLMEAEPFRHKGMWARPLAIHPRILAMAASTGGPTAFARVLGDLPADFGLPVVLVQHMGAAFMEGFAQWLDQQVTLPVVLARHGMMLERGRVLVAPGNQHMTVGTRGEVVLHDGPPVQGQRPSADVLFSSIARVFGGDGLGVLLTGMGEDGVEGLGRIRACGGYTIVEDRSTAVIHGMPGAAERAGAACISLPVHEIAPHILRIMAGSPIPTEGPSQP